MHESSLKCGCLRKFIKSSRSPFDPTWIPLYKTGAVLASGKSSKLITKLNLHNATLFHDEQLYQAKQIAFAISRQEANLGDLTLSSY